MDLVSAYGKLIKKKIENSPETARRMINLGLLYEEFRTKHMQDERMPKAYRYLNTFAVNRIREGLKHPENTAWVNIFAPVEILECFGLNCLSTEGLSSFMAGFTIEDSMIDAAESAGITSTLCSYHKSFTGALDLKVMPRVALAVTTSMLCDGNIQTFRHVEKVQGIPTYYIDTPAVVSEDSVDYVESQLYEMIEMIEDVRGQKLDKDELRKIIARENRSKELYAGFLKEAAGKHYPTTLTLQMYMLFASHLSIGTEGALKVYELLAEDIKKYPVHEGKSILWVHLLPFYQETLKSYFNYSDKYQIISTDMNADYMEHMDEDDPVRAIARKLIYNIYNGDYNRRIDAIKAMAKDGKADAVIQFCHWGCKQSAGGSVLLKEELSKENIPMLILDGDAVDRRNSHDGQIKTRLEAFLEILE